MTARRPITQRLRLIDDGTLDTVFQCRKCGEEIRYSADWRMYYLADDVGTLDYDYMVEVASDEHDDECTALDSADAGR